MRRLLVGMAIGMFATLSPCWVHADDQQIAQQIVQQLRQQKADGNLTGFGIDLEVESGIVWLKGHVSSKQQQHDVLDIVRHIRGVEQVVNDLQVKTTKSTNPVRPAVLKTTLDSKLLKKPGQLLASLNRNVKNAFISEETPIDGTEVAPSLAKVAQRVERQVPARGDTSIASDVISKLSAKKDSGDLRNFDLDVQVNNQVVWLSGRVASKDQQTLVLDVARRISGVKQVVNDLHVQQVITARTASTPVQPAPVTPATVETTVAASQPMPAAPARPQPMPAAPARPQPTPAAPARLQPMPAASANQVPLPFAPAQSVAYGQAVSGQPMAAVPAASGIARARFDHPTMPGYAWPSYAAYPNYGAVTYPRQYSPSAWPYIGPFYPYPQVPLGWRKVTLEWDDGWWMLDFKSK